MEASGGEGGVETPRSKQEGGEGVNKRENLPLNCIQPGWLAITREQILPSHDRD